MQISSKVTSKSQKIRQHISERLKNNLGGRERRTPSSSGSAKDVSEKKSEPRPMHPFADEFHWLSNSFRLDY